MSGNALARWLQFAVHGQTVHKRAPRRRVRRGPARNSGYRRWIGSLPSLVSGRPHCHACHTRNNGMRSKGSDFSCVPLTVDEHLEYDAGREAFEKRHGVCMAEVVKRLNHDWFAYAGRVK
jgi:hypothetical protein